MTELRTKCVEWPGHLSHEGYPHVVKSRVWKCGTVGIARWVYEQAYGPIPDGFTIDHVCHNGTGCAGGVGCLHRRCINPEHLEAVPNGVNVLRGEGRSAKEARQTHCHKGHPFDEQNTYRRNGKRWCRICRREAAKRKVQR